MNNTATTYTQTKKRTTKKRSAAQPQPKPRKNRHTTERPQPAARNRHADRASSGVQDTDVLPGWEEVNASNGRRKNRKNPTRKNRTSNSVLDQVSTRTFALYTFIAVILLGLYVGHVFGTQQTLERLEQLEQDNLRLTLEYNQKKARFDNHLSPDEVYRRAQLLGLQAGTEFGPPVLLKENN